MMMKVMTIAVTTRTSQAVTATEHGEQPMATLLATSTSKQPSQASGDAWKHRRLRLELHLKACQPISVMLEMKTLPQRAGAMQKP
jgi:hypothetical protein